MNKEYKPGNFYFFFNGEIYEILYIISPLFFAFLKTLFVENDTIGQLVTYLSYASLLLLFKPIYNLSVNSKEKYQVFDNKLVLFRQKSGKIIRKEFIFGKMYVEMKKSKFQYYLEVEEKGFKKEKYKIYIKDKVSWIELYKYLQEKNTI